MLLAAARGPARRAGRRLWTGLGVGYVGLPALALIWLRAMPDLGLAMLLWLLVVVWTTDTAAYFVGRAIGGPRLAPAISPSKTWAGLCGGMLGAALTGALVGLAARLRPPAAGRRPRRAARGRRPGSATSSNPASSAPPASRTAAR